MLECLLCHTIAGHSKSNFISQFVAILFYCSNLTSSLEVIATDRGAPAQSSTATVAVTVVDDNDNSPQCSPRMYAVSLREDVTASTAVAALACSDT